MGGWVDGCGPKLARNFSNQCLLHPAHATSHISITPHQITPHQIILHQIILQDHPTASPHSSITDSYTPTLPHTPLPHYPTNSPSLSPSPSLPHSLRSFTPSLAALVRWQLYQAIYFVSIDTVLFGQFVYYTCIRSSSPPADKVEEVTVPYRTVDEHTSLLTVRSTVDSDAYNSVNVSNSGVVVRSLWVFMACGLGALASLALSPYGSSSSSPAALSSAPVGGRILLAHTTRQSEILNIVGTILAWTSAALYLSSRLPQILKNYKRGSTDGLSLIMFFCAVMGNSFYSVSLILNTFGWHEYRTRLPYLIGSIGTLQFDFTVATQFWYYKGKEPKIQPTTLEP